MQNWKPYWEFSPLCTASLINKSKKQMMKASTERKIIRWFHLIASIPLIGFIYGPLSKISEAVLALKWVIFPLIVLSGLWLWKGQWLKKTIKRQRDLSRQQFPFLIHWIHRSQPRVRFLHFPLEKDSYEKKCAYLWQFVDLRFPYFFLCSDWWNF